MLNSLLQPFTIILMIVGSIFILRSCYLSLNLCGRSQAVNSVNTILETEFQKIINDYALEREKTFEGLFQQKIRFTCAQLMQSQKQGFDGEFLLGCMGREGDLNRQDERKLFKEAIQSLEIKQDDLSNDEFYAEQLKQNNTFKFNLLYEPLVLEIYDRLEEIEQKYLANSELPPEKRFPEWYFQHQSSSAFNKTISDHFPLTISNIKSEEGVWQTLFSSRKACTADLKVGNSPNTLDAKLFYNTLNHVEISGRVSTTSFGAELKSVMVDAKKLATPEERVNYFIQEIKLN